MNDTSLPEHIEYSAQCKLNEIARKLNEVREMVGAHWPNANFTICGDNFGASFYICRHEDSIEHVQSGISAQKWAILDMNSISEEEMNRIIEKLP